MRNFRYYTKPDSKNRVTVVGQFDPETNILRMAAARTSNKDQFVKKLGAAKAEGRLRSTKNQFLELQLPNFTAKDFVSAARELGEAVAETGEINLNVVAANLLVANQL